MTLRIISKPWKAMIMPSFSGKVGCTFHLLICFLWNFNICASCYIPLYTYPNFGMQNISKTSKSEQSKLEVYST